MNDLDPEKGTPDTIYLSALDHARTQAEIAFRDVLIFHRDVLNGGLDQALFNQARTVGALARCIKGYERLGLRDAAKMIKVADLHFETKAESNPDATNQLEALTAQYFAMTYGINGGSPDAIEYAAIVFVKSNEADFQSTFAGMKQSHPERFDAKKFAKDVAQLTRKFDA
jgi:hypothetical protein